VFSIAVPYCVKYSKQRALKKIAMGKHTHKGRAQGFIHCNSCKIPGGYEYILHVIIILLCKP
jgi:hypothetical protein